MTILGRTFVTDRVSWGSAFARLFTAAPMPDLQVLA